MLVQLLLRFKIIILMKKADLFLMNPLVKCIQLFMEKNISLIKKNSVMVKMDTCTSKEKTDLIVIKNMSQLERIM